MNFLPKPPELPHGEKMISFLEAVADDKGDIRSSYIRQQAIKNPNLSKFWYCQMVPDMQMPLNFATLKFESDKAHYLETGELPKDY